MDLTITFYGRLSSMAQSIANPFMLPRWCERDVIACGYRLAQLEQSLRLVLEETERLPTDFIRRLQLENELPDARAHAMIGPIGVYNDLGFLVALYSVLVTAKSVLDVYAKIVTAGLVRRSGLKGFNKAKDA